MIANAAHVVETAHDHTDGEAEPGAEPEAESAVALIRRTTRDQHVRLEETLDLMSSGLTIERYRTLLLGFAALHQTLDAEVGARLSPIAPDGRLVTLAFDARRKTASLAADLAHLGSSLPAPAVTFDLASIEHALGALYVCEGATLGGRIIAPHLLAVLGPDIPVSFFSSYGADVVPMWSTCRRVLNGLLDSPSAADVAASAAAAVFDRFADVLA